jgi:hypothetical protein
MNSFDSNISLKKYSEVTELNGTHCCLISENSFYCYVSPNREVTLLETKFIFSEYERLLSNKLLKVIIEFGDHAMLNEESRK